jgi:pimeloyl-ACP methyl ester carboxylesterase
MPWRQSHRSGWRRSSRSLLAIPPAARSPCHLSSNRAPGGTSGLCRSIRGAEAIAKDPKGFARIQWETWSPRGWFDEATFEAAARSFENPDWLAITLSSYRGRWRDEPRDPRYDLLHEKIASTEQLSVPTLMVQGGADGTVLAKSTEDKDKYFTRGYRRIVLDGVGHFPTREAPDAVVDAVLRHLS